MEKAIHTTRAILYFLYDKGVSFDSPEVNDVFNSVSAAWEHYWALEDSLAEQEANNAFVKAINILETNKWLAEYFLTNIK